ncbi:hypothetical protein [Gymnodinialimonas sp.]
MTAPALAQDEAIYAPCLAQFAAPEEFGNVDPYISAMEAAGWAHVPQAALTVDVTAALAEYEAGSTSLPSQFGSARDAQAFAARAAEWYAQDVQFVQVFTRDGVSASLSAVEYEPGQMGVLCSFAGMEVPGADAMFDADSVIDDLAVSIGAADVALPEKATRLTVTAIRFTGDAAVLAPLSVREGIGVSYRYEAPQ